MRNDAVTILRAPVTAPPVEGIQITFTPEEFLLLGYTVWDKLDGYDADNNFRETLAQKINEASLAAFGKSSASVFTLRGSEALTCVDAAKKIAAGVIR